ncbi:perakine reductase-like [Camellia sinensis]|uniref:perakine reductase-like n=1 Tax=Camellia sinensis TaxID=4442 RepID=UPI001035599D|nr:perakine reductase-like [Camellia sinensis]
MGLSGAYNALVSDEDGIVIIKYAFSKGITFFDTSDIYGVDHSNEILVGKEMLSLRWSIREEVARNKENQYYKFYRRIRNFEVEVALKKMKSNKTLGPDDIAIEAWKCLALKDLPQEKVQLATKFGIVKMEPTQVVVKGTVKYVCFCCEASLKVLRVDYIDLYYVHWIDTLVPIEETMWGAMGDVKVVDLGSDFFLVRLSNRDDYDHVLFDGP